MLTIYALANRVMQTFVRFAVLHTVHSYIPAPEHKFNFRDLVLLSLIRQEKAITASTVAKLLGTPQSSLVEWLNKFEKLDIITYASDKKDERKRPLRLTPRGEQFLEEFRERQASIQLLPSLSCLTDEEQQMFLSLVEKMEKGIERDWNHLFGRLPQVQA